jgi:hypothetical protein
VLEEYRKATIDDGGEAWSVAEYIQEWQAGAEADNRGPEVICLPGEDGSLHLVARDELGYLTRRWACWCYKFQPSCSHCAAGAR